MTLSDAIRLGAMLKPQCFHGMWDGVGSCALGAAYDAVGLSSSSDDFKVVAEAFPLFNHDRHVRCPECCETKYLICLIAHLNDTHRWTREQIAEWVESIERQHEPQVAAEGAEALR